MSSPSPATVAFGGNETTAEIWSLARAPREQAVLELAGSRPHALLLEGTRGWLFTGEDHGTIGIYSIRKKQRVARLLSLQRGSQPWRRLVRGLYLLSLSGVSGVARRLNRSRPPVYARNRLVRTGSILRSLTRASR